MATKKETENTETATLPALRTYAEIHRTLLEPIAPALISYRAATRNGPADIAYTNITDTKDLLDFRAGVWTSEIRSFQQVGNSLCIVVRISIHASDGVFSQDGTGISPLEVSFSDPFSKAFAQGFNRAAEGHGLARELWRKEDKQEMFRTEFQREQAGNAPPASSGGWSAEASNKAADETPVSQTPPPPIVDLGTGSAKKAEKKLIELCKNLNAAGAPFFGGDGQQKKWNSEVLNEYCQNGFDKSISEMDADEMEIMLIDLGETLAERQAMNEESTRTDTDTPTHTGGAMANENQINALTKLCEMKKLVESKVAEEASGGRVGTFDRLSEVEAAEAIKTVTKTKVAK